MTYINTTTGEYPLSEQEIRRRHPNVSFPLPFEPLDGYVEVEEVVKPVVDYTQTVSEAAPEAVQGGYRQQWVTASATEEEKAARTAMQARAVRAERTEKLRACDWTQLGDSPAQPVAQWRTYREGLRNISTQPGFPWEVVWPVEPGSQ